MVGFTELTGILKQSQTTMCSQKDLMKSSPGSFMFLCIEMCLCEADCCNASQRYNACCELRPLSHTNRHRFFNFILSQFQPPVLPRAPSVTQMFTHINTQTLHLNYIPFLQVATLEGEKGSLSSI